MTGVSAGGMATYEWSNYVLDHTKKAKFYALPDSGFFITDFYSDLVDMKVLRSYAKNLVDLVGVDEKEMPEPILKCTKKPGLELIDCFNTANYAEFLRSPMFIVQSPIDAYSLQNAVAVQCLNGQKPPFSLQSCSDEEFAAIEKYRKDSLEYIKNFKTRNNVGIWGPACVQHGFTQVSSFNNPNFKVSGQMVHEAIEKFMEDPENAEWHIEDEPWPSNKGCSGIINGFSLNREWNVLQE